MASPRGPEPRPTWPTGLYLSGRRVLITDDAIGGDPMVAASRSVPRAGRDTRMLWAERSGHRRISEVRRGGLRFAFYGRVSTEDYQDPATSRVRQRAQAEALVKGFGRIVAEFFDVGQSRVLPWARRPEAAALVAAMADPDRVFDAMVVGEY